MPFQQLVVVLLLLALAPLQTALPRPQLKYDHAQLLTADTYQATLDANRVVFMVFYSPNCYACLKTAPRFDAVAKYFEKVVGVAVGALNLKEEPEIADREDIMKYPTFRLFLGGEAIDYNGNGDSEAMI